MADVTFERVNVLGVGVSAINIAMAVEQIDTWIKARSTRTYVTVSGVHGVMECQRDELVRQIHNDAGMVTPDGMPLVWLGKRAGYRHMDRVYGPDLIHAVMERSQSAGYRHYLYGGATGVPELLKKKLQEEYNNITVVGTYSPPFRPLTGEEDAATVQMINDTQPDIVWVGLGTPKQEKWMHAHLGRINASVMIGVGAAFDFHSGLKPQAPRFIQRSGFEWLFRLATEPRRLWKRYLINNPLFVLGVLRQELGLRKYTL